MIVLASLPRSGSTYLARSIAGLRQRGGAPEGGFRQHRIIKTHRPPDEVEGISEADRAIFLHGDVAAAVVSTQENRHDPTHFANCGREYDPDVDLLAEDYLGYTDLAEAWFDPPLPTLEIRYEALEERALRWQVELWVGRPIEWNSWQFRATHPTIEECGRVMQTYGDLIRMLDHGWEARIHGPWSDA